MNISLSAVFMIVASFMVASMLNIYPLSFALAPFRPMVMVMVMIFWVIYQPKLVGVSAAFLVGILSDLLLDTHLGHQAFCMVVTVFLLRIATNYTKRLSFASTWILAAASLLLYRILLWLFEMFSHEDFVWVGFISLVMSIVTFPMVYWLLSVLQQKIQPSGIQNDSLRY